RPPTPTLTLFPYTTLFRSRHRQNYGVVCRQRSCEIRLSGAALERTSGARSFGPLGREIRRQANALRGALAFERYYLRSETEARSDRKSTRLNSSHLGISYA